MRKRHGWELCMDGALTAVATALRGNSGVIGVGRAQAQPEVSLAEM
jgi:hypothetical protein